MKHFYLALTSLFIFASTGFSQINIHFWNFNTGAGTTAGNKWPSPIPATTTVGGGVLTHNFTNTEDFAGSTLDAPGFPAPAAGASFSVQDALNNGNAMVLNVPSTGFENLKLTYATRGTSTGFTTHQIDYTTDGTNYTPFTTITGRNNATYALMTVDFSTVTAANDNPHFKIRITLSGATSTSGNNRIDNIRLSGTSLTNNTASVAFGANASEPATNGSFTINLSSPAPASGVTVTYTLSGTATVNSDYTHPQAGSVTISAGSSSGTVSINVIDDAISENTETVIITLTSANNGYNITGGTVTLSISDNDITTGVIGQVYNFNNCSSAITQGFRQFSVSGAQVWSCTKFGRTYTSDPSNDSALEMNGFSGAPLANEDWLISPRYDLSTTNAPLLKFYSRTNFAGNALQLKVSTNYSGFGDPNAATWTNLDGRFPAPSSNIWTMSDSISLAGFAVPNVFIAWVYTSSTTAAARWTLDDISVRGSCIPPTHQATGLILTPGINFINGSFTAAAAGSVPAGGYLIIASTSPTLSAQPASGTAYAVDDEVGNGTVVAVGAGTSFTASNLNPATTYYFFVYSYTNALSCFNTTNPLTSSVATNAPPACTPPSIQASNFQATNITGNSIDINFTRGNGDNVLVIARTNSAVNQQPIRGVDYAVGNQIGTGNFVVYKGPAGGFTYSGLTANTTYHFAVYEYFNSNFCYNLNQLTGSATTSCVTPVNVVSLNAMSGNARVTLTWNNPTASCFDEIIVVASNAPITGQGSDFTGPANPVYSSPNQVVYRGTGTTITVTGLTNATTYYFKVFARKATVYSSGATITGNPFDPAAGYVYLYGNLHSHSSFSDGNKDDPSKKPIDDFRYARDARCMDFLGISEHNHSGAGMNIANYPIGFSHAETVNGEVGPNGNSIITMWGMEWGVISNGGHVLVYGFNDQLIGWEPGNFHIYCAKNDYASLWNIINNQPNAFATLAHPDLNDFNNLGIGPYNVVADNAVVGTAIESGPAFSTDTTYGDYPFPLANFDYYKTMLAKGYRLGAQHDGDNHNLTFGRQSENRMVVLATARNRQELVAAIRAMRFYASNDCNVKVDYKLAGNPMGSNVTRAGLPTINVSVSDPDAVEAVDSIYIYGGRIGGPTNLNPIRRYGASATITFDATDVANTQADNTTWYYFVTVKQSDGQRVVTSPIWYTRNDAAVPVTLLDLKAIYHPNHTVDVKWNTSQEINSKEFIIEKSINEGVRFDSIGKIQAAGFSNVMRSYSFHDPRPVLGNNYYRLRQVDIDGRTEISRVVSVTTKVKSDPFFSIYPTMVSAFTYLHSTSTETSDATYKVLDATGRVLIEKKISIDRNHPFRIDLDGLNRGIYFIQIVSGVKKVTEKVVLQ
jgi:trimeric autotransporter adhesin